MPNYNYHCYDCERTALELFADRLVESDGEPCLPMELYEEFVLFETSHSMNPSEDELKEALCCPRCSGCNCRKSLHGVSVHSYVKGYGWLDRDGAKRDMNRYQLHMSDPYASFRVPGEVDHIDAQLKRAGKHDPNSKHFAVKYGEMEKAVEQSVLKRQRPED